MLPFAWIGPSYLMLTAALQRAHEVTAAKSAFIRRRAATCFVSWGVGGVGGSVCAWEGGSGVGV